MNAFIAHVGDGNCIDVGDTIRRRRSFKEMATKLPRGSERMKFEALSARKDLFPDGTFSVWGVPTSARASYDITQKGDIVFIASVAGKDGFIEAFGTVVHLPYDVFPIASRILWPSAPPGEKFPHLMFLDVVVGSLSWYEFCCDLVYPASWNPRGWYRRLDRHRARDLTWQEYREYLCEKHQFTNPA